MLHKTGVEAYQQHKQLFMLMTARKYNGPWEAFGGRIFRSLRETNRILYDFIRKVIAKNFIDYELEVLEQGLAIFLNGLPNIPTISAWSCEVTQLDLSKGKELYVYTAVQDEFYPDGLDIAFKAFADYIREVCRTETLLSRKILIMGYIISSVIIHQNEYGNIEKQITG